MKQAPDFEREADWRLKTAGSVFLEPETFFSSFGRCVAFRRQTCCPSPCHPCDGQSFARSGGPGNALAGHRTNKIVGAHGQAIVAMSAAVQAPLPDSAYRTLW
jgi:hypothetical protein